MTKQEMIERLGELARRLELCEQRITQMEQRLWETSQIPRQEPTTIVYGVWSERTAPSSVTTTDVSGLFDESGTNELYIDLSNITGGGEGS
jgi:hypothetical protein